MNKGRERIAVKILQGIPCPIGAPLAVVCLAAAVHAGNPAMKNAPTVSRALPKHSAVHAAQPGQDLFRGKVIPLREALKRRGIDSGEEFDKQVALLTSQDEIIPIVPDWRGRAFFQDARLRNREVELVGKRKAGVPYLQVLIIFTFDEKGNRQYTDYYCDTCGFPMYEIKPCECCQGPLRLRFQRRDLPDYIKNKLPKSAASLKTSP